MNILINGGSVSRGPGSWPYWIQQSLSCDLVNLSQSGAGNNYVHETTISELAQRNYDLVVIQWTTFNRFDFKVKHIEQFKGTIFTSEHQHRHNDWPEKVVYPINDQDYVEKDWIFGCGVSINGDPDLALNSAFNGFYNHCGPAQQQYHSLMKIISLQSFLQVKKIPYLFVFARPFRILTSYDHLKNLIDWQHCYTDNYILNIAEQENSWDTDGFHPSAESYKKFADLILPEIQMTSS